MLNRKGSVTLIEHQQVSWRLVKVENWDNKSYKRYTQLMTILQLMMTDHNNKIVVANV